MADQPPAANFGICFMGRDKVTAAMRNLSGRQVKDRKLEVKILSSLSPLLSNTCQILFLSGKKSLEYDLKQIAGYDVLTVGDTEDFLERGGGIMISLAREKIGFSINQSTLELARVTPDQKLLALAADIR